MPSPNQYRYLPLGDGHLIRLLHLKPGEQSDPIQISIFETHLEQGTYEALSYTWGDSSEPSLITCNEEGDTLQITRNCEAALRRLRSRTETRILWIDAISIDQKNVLERNQQVQLMSDIYRHAQRVLAYLGEASNDSDTGIDFVLQDAKGLTSSGRPTVGLGPDTTSSPQQEALDHILDRSYFKRVWILQEIVFAKEIRIVVGDRTVDWADFAKTVFYVDMNKKMYLGANYDQKPPSVVFYRDRSTSLPSGRPRSEMPQSLLELLRDTRHCQSTEPRDKIHALLGMSTEREERALAPDYSLTTQQTFIQLTEFLINRDKRLDVLSHVQGHSPIEDLPSWVPDWSFPGNAEVLGHKKDTVRPYKASLGMPASVIFQNDPESILVRGKVFDTVATVGPVYRPGTASSTATLQRWESMVSESQSSREGDASSSFMDLLIAYPPYAAPNAFGRFFNSWRRAIIGQESLGPSQRSAATIFQDQVKKASSGRALFVTERGYIGLGPADILLGSKVAVFLGASVPFILCEQQDYFNLVGECFVLGIMNGETLQDGTVELQMITIR